MGVPSSVGLGLRVLYIPLVIGFMKSYIADACPLFFHSAVIIIIITVIKSLVSLNEEQEKLDVCWNGVDQILWAKFCPAAPHPGLMH
jgi:hypothetical protein